MHTLRRSSIVESRRGLTLYEIVLSLTIFLGAMLAISQIISNGSRAAIQSRLETQAILRCESKLAEILAGVEPMESATDVQFENDTGNWAWSLDVAAGPHDALLDLSLTVSHLAEDSTPDVTYSVRRLVRDPQLYVDAAEAAEAIAAESESETEE